MSDNNLPAALSDPATIAMIRLPVDVTVLAAFSRPFEKIAKSRGGAAMMRQEGEWLIITTKPEVPK